jgi:hypothetical protein
MQLTAAALDLDGRALTEVEAGGALRLLAYAGQTAELDPDA